MAQCDKLKVSLTAVAAAFKRLPDGRLAKVMYKQVVLTMMQLQHYIRLFAHDQNQNSADLDPGNRHHGY